MRLLLTLASLAACAAAQSYVRDVYPIWEKHCLGCHTSGTNMGSLDLESWEGLLRGGNHGTILVPGDLAASRLYTMLTGEGKPAMPMDGKVLSAAEIDIVRRWIVNGATPPTPAEIAILKRRADGQESPITALAWHPRDELAVARGADLVLLAPGSRDVRLSLIAPAPVTALAFSPDGRQLATALPDEIVLWDLASRRILNRLSTAATALAFSPDGLSLAVATPDHPIQIWSLTRPTLTRKLPGQPSPIAALAFTSQGQLLSAAQDRSLKLWSPLTGDCLSTRTASGQPLALSPDARFLLTANPGSLQITRQSDGLEIRTPAPAVPTSLPAISPDGHRVAFARPDGAFQLLHFPPKP